MRKLLITLVSILILTGAAEARMYQWTNPASGTVQLSGTALSWYRSFEKRPRVFVFENGELIDDTAVQVAETQRLQLRAAAFESTGGDISIEEEAENNAKELHAAMEKATVFGVDVGAVAGAAATFSTTSTASTGANTLCIMRCLRSPPSTNSIEI
ncbi:MAG: hypothetical protein VX929_02880 [Pseudomonadota bacterium]|nr:hypothetical protein [Pseudomonadota bacterium]